MWGVGCGGRAGCKRAAQPGPAELPGAAGPAAAGLRSRTGVSARRTRPGPRRPSHARVPSSALSPGAAPRPRGSTAAEGSGLQASGRAAEPRRPPPPHLHSPALWACSPRAEPRHFPPTSVWPLLPLQVRGVSSGRFPGGPRGGSRAPSPCGGAGREPGRCCAAAIFPVLPPRKCASRASGRLPRPRAPGAPARCGGGGASLAQRPSRSCPPSLNSQTCRRGRGGTG